MSSMQPRYTTAPLVKEMAALRTRGNLRQELLGHYYT